MVVHYVCVRMTRSSELLNNYLELVSSELTWLSVQNLRTLFLEPFFNANRAGLVFLEGRKHDKFIFYLPLVAVSTLISRH